MDEERELRFRPGGGSSPAREPNSNIELRGHGGDMGGVGSDVTTIDEMIDALPAMAPADQDVLSVPIHSVLSDENILPDDAIVPITPAAVEDVPFLRINLASGPVLGKDQPSAWRHGEAVRLSSGNRRPEENIG